MYYVAHAQEEDTYNVLSCRYAKTDHSIHNTTR